MNKNGPSVENFDASQKVILEKSIGSVCGKARACIYLCMGNVFNIFSVRQNAPQYASK